MEVSPIQPSSALDRTEKSTQPMRRGLIVPQDILCSGGSTPSFFVKIWQVIWFLPSIAINFVIRVLKDVLFILSFGILFRESYDPKEIQAALETVIKDLQSNKNSPERKGEILKGFFNEFPGLRERMMRTWIEIMRIAEVKLPSDQLSRKRVQELRRELDEKLKQCDSKLLESYLSHLSENKGL